MDLFLQFVEAEEKKAADATTRAAQEEAQRLKWSMKLAQDSAAAAIRKSEQEAKQTKHKVAEEVRQAHIEARQNKRELERTKQKLRFENEKRAKFLAQQREFERTKKDTRYQPDLEEFSVATAGRDVGDALEDGTIPAAALPVGLVALAGLAYLIVGLLFG